MRTSRLGKLALGTAMAAAGCDEDEDALLTVNDEDRGTIDGIDGIDCSVAAAGGGAASGGAVKAWLPALGVVAARLRWRSASAKE